MSKLRYLYGIDKADWLNMSYVEAFKRKNDLAYILISKLLEVHHSKRDFTRIADIQKAINYNNERLAE